MIDLYMCEYCVNFYNIKMGWFDKISSWGQKAFGHVKDFLGGKKSGIVSKIVNGANSILPGAGDYLHKTGRDAF